MPYPVVLPTNYSYVVLVALGVVPVLSFLQGESVGLCRLSAGISYPNCYASPQHAKESRLAYKFNCAQRAHANLLENMAQTMMTMMVAGLIYPRWTAGLGLTWVTFRALFAYGYITSEKPDGKGRFLGIGCWIAQAGIWGLCISTALKML